MDMHRVGNRGNRDTSACKFFEFDLKKLKFDYQAEFKLELVKPNLSSNGSRAQSGFSF